MTEFGTRLKELRIGLNLTQDEAAAEVNVSKQAISKWENGHGLPDVSSLSALAGLYGTTVDYLLTGDEKVRVEERIVEKEKIVEVDEPLSEDLLKGLLHSYQLVCNGYYGRILVGTVDVIGSSILLAKIAKNMRADSSTDIFLLTMVIFLLVGGIVAVILGFRSKKKWEQRKKEIEEKTGKVIGYWGYKN
ncbi:MAG: helix-turn-helix domain-containing protein [Clostridia bacterium]|nr:helix-turn-helix domain-containing protein [Clostridia bacterium]